MTAHECEHLMLALSVLALATLVMAAAFRTWWLAVWGAGCLVTDVELARRAHGRRRRVAAGG